MTRIDLARNLLMLSNSAVLISCLFLFDINIQGIYARHCEDLAVQINQGKLQGREYTSSLNKSKFQAFLGIPYAKPPLEGLRFQAPRPADRWHGVYDATFERDECPQTGFLFKKIIFGSEDCLHLNVYTPQPPCKINVPKSVMVFIHGGAFATGSGSRKIYSADYLIMYDIILVTINYRLQAFGFLNLGLQDCPGNVGLKDQVLALKWVKNNIAKFGGDPGKVTIFGESAGSSSVHYHLLSLMSKGLFHRAIMESGSSLCPWALTYDPLEQAFEIGKQSGYEGKDKQKLLQHLRKLSVRELTTAAADTIGHYQEKYPARFTSISPSVEEIKENAFLPDLPDNLVKKATPVPAIFGLNNKEGILLFLNADKDIVQKLHDDFSIVVTNNFKVHPNSVHELSAKIKQFYFGNEDVTLSNADHLVGLYTDTYFYYIYEAMNFLTHSSSSPYVYEFSYNGQLNYIKTLVNIAEGTELKGASHADELFYLFDLHITPIELPTDDESWEMIKSMTLMWTNFAKTGNPSGEVEWKPSTSSKPQYLEINKHKKMIAGKLNERRLHFLKNLLEPAMVPGSQPYNIF